MCVAARNRQKANKFLFLRLKSPKFIDSAANRKQVYDFLLVINSNLGPISHRYSNTATYWLKIADFFYPSPIYRFRLKWLLWILWESFTDPKTRVFQAADGENLVILANFTVFDWSTRVTDGQTVLRWLRCAAAVAAVARKKAMRKINCKSLSNAQMFQETINFSCTKKRQTGIAASVMWHCLDRVESYLFHGRGRRRVLPRHTCDIQTREAISRHVSVDWDYGHS